MNPGPAVTGLIRVADDLGLPRPSSAGPQYDDWGELELVVDLGETTETDLRRWHSLVGGGREARSGDGIAFTFTGSFGGETIRLTGRLPG